MGGSLSMESIAELLSELEHKQIVLAIDTVVPDRLRYYPKKRVKRDLLERLRHHKSALMSLLRQKELPSDISNWPEHWREEFEERAAIMEYDGGLPRLEAEKKAETIVRTFYRENSAY